MEKLQSKGAGRRVLVIGLDGGTFRILEPLAQKGKIPNLKRLMEQGFKAELLSTVPPISAPAWATFITGKNPGKHGILHFVALKPEESSEDGLEIFPGGFSLVNLRSIRERTLWQIIGEAGKKVGVMNVPICYPPSAVNGFMICGMLTPPSAKNFTYPPELADRLGEYEIDLDLEEKEYDFPRETVVERLIELMQKRAKAARRLMREQPWDLFLLVFTETDRLHHMFWKGLDPRDPDHESPEVQRYRALVEGFYEKMDLAVGELIEEAGQGALVIVMSDHGFGPHAQRRVFKYVVMRELGLAGPASRSLVIILRSLIEKRLGLNREAAYRYASKVLPHSWLKRLERRIRAKERLAWSKSEAFVVTLSEDIGGIYVNRSNLKDEREYKALRAQLTEKLLALRDPEKGQRIVLEVVDRKQLYHGSALEEMPDLVFFLAPGYGLSGGVGRQGTLVGPVFQKKGKQGTHRREGILLMAGPEIQESQSEKSFALADLAATILYALGLPIPNDMDGKVIRAAFTPSFRQHNPMRFYEASPVAEALEEPKPTLWETEEDTEAIRKRLAGLGYLD